MVPREGFRPTSQKALLFAFGPGSRSRSLARHRSACSNPTKSKQFDFFPTQLKNRAQTRCFNWYPGRDSARQCRASTTNRPRGSIRFQRHHIKKSTMKVNYLIWYPGRDSNPRPVG